MVKWRKEAVAAALGFDPTAKPDLRLPNLDLEGSESYSLIR